MKTRPWAPWLIGALAFVAFIPVLNAGFVTWDDVSNFTSNAHYRGLGTKELSWMWTTFLMGHYAPLTWMTLGLDYTIWGMDARGYHFTNLLLHCVNAVLVYVLSQRLLSFIFPTAFRQRLELAGICSALLFAVHPLRVESVAWVTERRDVLSMALALSSVLLYLRAVREAVIDRRAYVAALLCFTCALLSKATVMTLPAVLAVLNVYPLRRIPAESWLGSASRRVYAELIPFALPACGMVVLSLVALHPPDQLLLAQKVAVSAYSLMFYIWKTLLPWHLAPLYEMPKHVAILAPKFLVAYLFCTLYALTMICTRRRRPGVATALLLFLVIALPMLGVVQNGPQIAADRYTYHAAPALSLLAGAGVMMIADSTLFAGVAVVGTLLLGLAALTWRQAALWQSSEALWAQVLAVDENTSVGQTAYADVLMKKGDLAGAITHYQHAIDIDPDYVENHNNLGLALVARGSLEEGKAEFLRALALRPRFPDAEINLGALLAQSGDLDGAIEHYARALTFNPDMANAHVDWGNALVRQGKLDEAITHYEQAARIHPGDAEIHTNWGVALARKGNFEGAITQFRDALRIEPAHVAAQSFLERAEAQLAAQQSR